MATRLTYTTGARSPELDRAFESALVEARERDPEPLAHLVSGRDLTVGDSFAREDPSRCDRVASRAYEGAEAVAEAVEAARTAQRDWRRLPHAERVAVMRATERLIDERNIDVLRPYGVFAVIAPFNFPFALGFGMTAAALAAGNAVVLKPPEDAPRSGGAVARLLAEAGVPDGVISLVHGGPATGEALVGSAIDGVAFTGSAEVGREIGRRLSEGPFPKPVLAEMGGKNATMVGASADLDAAAEGIAKAAFGFSGQKCSACSRAIVADEVHDELVERLAAIALGYSVGDPADPDAATGPVVNERAVERFERSVEAARRDGVVAAGGARGDDAGWFVEPTVVSGLPLGHQLSRDELFLPFITVVRVPDFDAALTEANAVPYGLTAGVFSRDDDELDRFLDEIEAGVVYVNRRAGATTGAWPGIQSFCGWKSSGLTGKGGLGPYYVQQFAREQSRTIVEQ